MTFLEPPTREITFPQASGLSQVFWDACREARLIYQLFDATHPQFDPSPISRVNASRRFDWVESRGTGSVYSYTIVWRPQTPQFGSPYAVAIIDLDEGYQMMSNIIGCDHEEIQVGMRVAVRFHTIGDRTMPYFSPL